MRQLVRRRNKDLFQLCLTTRRCSMRQHHYTPPPSAPLPLPSGPRWARCRLRDQSARQPDAMGSPSSNWAQKRRRRELGRLVPSERARVPKLPAPSPEATSQGPLPNSLGRVGCRVAISKPAANHSVLLASRFEPSACESHPGRPRNT